jgi:hypothetical protein
VDQFEYQLPTSFGRSKNMILRLKADMSLFGRCVALAWPAGPVLFRAIRRAEETSKANG